MGPPDLIKLCLWIVLRQVYPCIYTHIYISSIIEAWNNRFAVSRVFSSRGGGEVFGDTVTHVDRHTPNGPDCVLRATFAPYDRLKIIKNLGRALLDELENLFWSYWAHRLGFWSAPSTGHSIRVNMQSDYALSLTTRFHLCFFPLFSFVSLSFFLSCTIWKCSLFLVFFGFLSFPYSYIVKSLKHSDIVGGGNDCKTPLFQEELLIEQWVEQIQHFCWHPISICLSICCSTRRSSSALYRALTR